LYQHARFTVTITAGVRRATKERSLHRTYRRFFIL
jgi:hypothetical protein